MKEFLDCYEILKVDPKSSLKEIKARYHELILKFHPDKLRESSETPEKFMIYKKAYDILVNQRGNHDKERLMRGVQSPILTEIALYDLDMNEDDVAFYDCRCGERYNLTEDQMNMLTMLDNEKQSLELQCNGCSYRIVVFNQD